MIEQDCRSIGEVTDPNDPQIIIAQDVHIERDGKPYILTVGTPAYLEDIRRQNDQLSVGDPAIVDDKILALEPNLVGDIQQICARLSSLPTSQLEPFLTEQTSR